MQPDAQVTLKGPTLYRLTAAPNQSFISTFFVIPETLFFSSANEQRSSSYVIYLQDPSLTTKSNSASRRRDGKDIRVDSVQKVHVSKQWEHARQSALVSRLRFQVEHATSFVGTDFVQGRIGDNWCGATDIRPLDETPKRLLRIPLES